MATKSALSNCDFQQVEAARVKLCRGRIIHLVCRDLEHLALEIYGVSSGPSLKTGFAVNNETTSARRWLDVISTGAHYRERSTGAADGAAISVEFRLYKFLGLKLGVSELATFCARTRWRS